MTEKDGIDLRSESDIDGVESAVEGVDATLTVLATSTVSHRHYRQRMG